MIFWILSLIFALGIIALTYSIAKTDIVESIMAFGTMVLGLGLFLGIYSLICYGILYINSNIKYDGKIEENIVCMRLGDNLEARCFLFGGSVDQQQYYFYCKQRSDEGFESSKIIATKTVVYENDNVYPHVERFLARNINPKWAHILLPSFLTLSENLYETNYVVYVPKGTVARSFSIR